MVESSVQTTDFGASIVLETRMRVRVLSHILNRFIVVPL